MSDTNTNKSTEFNNELKQNQVYTEKYNLAIPNENDYYDRGLYEDNFRKLDSHKHLTDDLYYGSNVDEDGTLVPDENKKFIIDENGVINPKHMPLEAQHIIKTVNTVNDMLKLTKDDVQNGDIVEVLTEFTMNGELYNTNSVFLVIDDNELNSFSSYKKYAGTQSWSSVYNKPTSFVPINHASQTDEYGRSSYLTYGHVKLYTPLTTLNPYPPITKKDEVIWLSKMWISDNEGYDLNKFYNNLQPTIVNLFNDSGFDLSEIVYMKNRSVYKLDGTIPSNTTAIIEVTKPANSSTNGSINIDRLFTNNIAPYTYAKAITIEPKLINNSFNLFRDFTDEYICNITSDTKGICSEMEDDISKNGGTLLIHLSTTANAKSGCMLQRVTTLPSKSSVAQKIYMRTSYSPNALSDTWRTVWESNGTSKGSRKINANDIENNAVNTQHLMQSSISSEKIKNNAITWNKLDEFSMYGILSGYTRQLISNHLMAPIISWHLKKIPIGSNTNKDSLVLVVGNDTDDNIDTFISRMKAKDTCTILSNFVDQRYDLSESWMTYPITIFYSGKLPSDFSEDIISSEYPYYNNCILTNITLKGILGENGTIPTSSGYSLLLYDGGVITGPVKGFSY